MFNTKLRSFNYDCYFFLYKNVEFFFYFNIYMIYFIKLQNVLNLLNLIFLEKLLLICDQEKKLKGSMNNVLVKEGRLKKEKKYEIFNFLNISEFVYSHKQKEIYLNRFNIRIGFFLNNHLVLQKKFIDDKFYFLKLNKIFNLFFMKIKTLGTIFFVQYRIYGLGFKIKKSGLLNGRSIRIDIGFGHSIYYRLPSVIKFLKRKRHFLLYSTNFTHLVFVKNHINNFKLLNPYKIRGLKDLKYDIKMKKGKKQSKK